MRRNQSGKLLPNEARCAHRHPLEVRQQPNVVRLDVGSFPLDLTHVRDRLIGSWATRSIWSLHFAWEVCLIIDRPDEVLAIELKWGRQVNRTD